MTTNKDSLASKGNSVLMLEKLAVSCQSKRNRAIAGAMIIGGLILAIAPAFI